MSDGDAHAGQAHSPPNNSSSAVAPGGGGAAVPPSGIGSIAPTVRGGESTPPCTGVYDAGLPGVHLLPSQFDEVRSLSGVFAKMRLEAGLRLSDRGSHGDCGFLCMAVALRSQGKLPPLDATAFASPMLRDQHSAGSLRALTCVHGRRPETQLAVIAQSGVGGGEAVTFATAMMSSFAAWLSRDHAARFGDDTLTLGTYLSLMSISANLDAEPPTLGTYLDSGGLTLIADLYLVRIVVRLYDSGGAEVPSSPQIFLPRDGVRPTTEVCLRCKADEHFVLEAHETPGPVPPSNASSAPDASIPPPVGVWAAYPTWVKVSDEAAAEVARLGRAFRAEQDALGRARRLAQELATELSAAEPPPAEPPALPALPVTGLDGTIANEVAMISTEAAAEVARRGRAFQAQQLNLRQARLQTTAAVDANRVLGELAADGVVSVGAQRDGIISAAASASGRSTSGVNKRDRTAAFSPDADRQGVLALRDDACQDAATHVTPLRRDPSPAGGCNICGGVDAFGSTMACAYCQQDLCPVCYPPTQHEPCCSAQRSPSPEELELAEHACERCGRTWLCLPPTETHADCEYCKDEDAPLDLTLLGPLVRAPPVTRNHGSNSPFGGYVLKVATLPFGGYSPQGNFARQYVLECLAQEAEVPYNSVCSMLFGHSQLHAQAVVLLGIGAYGTARHAQAFSELREDVDTDSATTAMRGLAEELLGLEDPEAAGRATRTMLARMREVAYPLVHLGRDPAASHRVFAVHADAVIDDGVDGATARFQSNSEICALIAVPLESLSGQPREVEVVDVLGQRHRLRGGRHLGAHRVQWAREMLAEIEAYAPNAPRPAEPRATPRGGEAASGTGGSGEGGSLDAAPAPKGGTQAELSGFTFPLRSLDEVRRLRRCGPAAPTDLVGFEFTGAMRLALEAAGRSALSVDWRTCEAGGMHAVLDVRDVVELGGWERVFLFPPCFQQLRADRDCLQAKIADCRAFWGCAMVLWCFCVQATLLVVEQPDTIVADFVTLSFMEFRTSCFRDEPDKFVRLFLRNAVLPLPFAADPSARRPVRPYLEYATSDARDRAKSSWLPFANMCRALAHVAPTEEPPPRQADYSELIESFAAAWHAAGYPVPAGYDDPRAMPPPGARRYQDFRGPGDGRVPPGVVPLLAAPRARGGATQIEPPRTGLLGGARGDRNQDLLMIGNRIRHMGRAGVALYDVTGVDTVQRHAYIVTNVLTGRADCRIDLVPSKRKGVDEVVAALGEWQLLPGSRDVDPFSPDSYVCDECFAQSTFRPCIICNGGAVSSGHALVMEGGETVITLDAEAVVASVPPAADGTPRALAAPRRALLPTVDVRDATEATVLLVFVSVLLRPLVYAHVNGFTMHGVVVPSLDSRTSCVHAAQQLVSKAVGATAASAFLVGEYVGGARLTVAPLDFRPARRLMCRTRVARLAQLAAGGTFLWCTLDALCNTPMGDAAARAILACEAYVKPGHMLADFQADASAAPLAFRIGAVAATSVLSRPLLDHITSPPAWRAIAESGRQNQRLIDALTAASADHLLAGWADRVGPIDPTDVPASLLAALPSFGEYGLETRAYTPVYRPYVTAWLPLPPAQPEAPPGAPTCIRSPADLMLPDTQLVVAAWLRHALQDLQRIRLAVDEGRAAQLSDGSERRDRPRALAIGQLELHPWARGRVWDCRGPCCKLLDFRAPINTHLNLTYLQRRLADYPDQYFVANLLEGARLDADVELQSVFVPHLVSLPKGYKAVGKELRRMRGLGWYDFFPDFPFWPMYLNAQGSTARKLELDRDRRTTEGGGPRMPTFDLSGLAAISINAASFMYHMPQHFVTDTRPEMLAWLEARGLPPPSAADELRRTVSKWHKELKPDLAKLMRDLAILKRAGRLLDQPVYGFGDDAKDYFNQLAMAECELHKLGIIFLAEPGDLTTMAPVGSPFEDNSAEQLVFISELRLGFGTHGASNLAQRFSEALLHLFRTDMDAADAASFDNHGDPNSAMSRWLAARQKVAERLALDECHAEGTCPHGPAAAAVELHYQQQRRLYTAYMYTDDPIWIVVGVDRTLRALRVWRQLTDAIGLIMAIPEKRHLGTQILWLGILVIISLGIVVVPKAKLLRASSAVTAVLAGGQPFHFYRSLMGLLEHLRAVNLQGRNVMHGLYTPHSPLGASRFGPEGRVYCDELMRKQLQRWCHLLRRSAGVSVRRAFTRDEVEPPPSSLTVFACSDACFGDADPNGIGGFCHGQYWRFAVPTYDEDVLSTPLLEFLGVVFNIIALADSVLPLLGDQGTLLLRTDALTTALVLPRESQKSPLLVDAFHFLTGTEEWRLLSPRLRIQHIFGDSMAMSDPLSRNRLHEFFARCRQLGIQPVNVALPQLCRQIYDQVVVLERARRLHAQRVEPIISGGGGLIEALLAQRHPSSACRSTQPVSSAAPIGPPWLGPPGMVASPARRAAPPPSTTFMGRLGAANGVVVADPTEPTPKAPRLAASLPLPSLTLPERALRRLANSRLAAASKTYADARALALTGGPDPSMALRADVASLCFAGESLSDFSEFGTNTNTLKKDDRAWEFWETICERVGTSPLRTPQEVRDNPERQAWLLAILMLYASAVCVAKTPGRMCIKPRSALAYPLAIIRIFGRWGTPMPGFKLLQAQLKGLSRAYLAYHGPKSLAPKRAEPMRFYMVRDMNNIAANGSISIGQRVWDDDDLTVFMFRRLNLISIRCATRLAEWVWHSSGEIFYMVRSDLWWRIGNRVIMDPTVEELRNLSPGDAAYANPPRSKPDQTGEIHCPFPICFPFTHDEDNAAAALRDIELRCPCHGTDRQTRPIIADEAGNPYTHGVLDRMLHNVLVFKYGKAFASLFSWHSYRSGLCCALFAAGCPDAINQLICRWMCPESLLAYRRMGANANGAWVDKASLATVDSIQSVNAPRVDHDASAAELFAYMDSKNANSRQSPLMREWAEEANPPGTPTARAKSRRQDPVADAAPAPAAATPDLRPIDAANAVGRHVLVPAEIYPTYRCSEQQGRGWECIVMTASSLTAKVRFVSARTSDGRPYVDERLPLALLQPM